MSIPFQDSETAKNLLRAFAGESQARNRYDFAANLCQKQELQAMAFIFQATAKQEQAHAKVFWDHLQALNGQNLPIYGAYPIEGTNRILELLRAAQHNEHEEHGSVYPSFAAIATQEGFPEAAASFRQIAAIEQLHGERFGLLADQLESGALFVSQIETGCKFPLDNGEIHCGYQYGTSNEVLPGQIAVVSVKEGLLLLIKDFPEV